MGKDSKTRGFSAFALSAGIVIENHRRGSFKLKIRKISALSLCCILPLFLLVGCRSASYQAPDPDQIVFKQFEEVKEGQEIAVVTTSEGVITMVLYGEEAPKTVAHFKKLVSDGFYNDKDIFSQADPHTFITGASDENGSTGEVVTDDGKPIECEVTQNLWHFSGAVSVLGQEKSRFSGTMVSDSRFFMIGNVDATAEMVQEMEKYNYPDKVINAYKEHGGLPQYTGAYTVFGQIIDGIDVVDKLSQMAIDEQTGKTTGAKLIKIELSTYHKGDSASSAASSPDTGSQDAADASSGGESN